jgi:hypothetical protein
MQARYLLPFLSLLLLSSAKGTAQQTDSSAALDFARQFAAPELETLMVMEQDVPVLISESTIPANRGVMVILADTGSGDYLSFQPLAKEMNQLGWTTMLMPVMTPASSASNVSTATQTTEASAPGQNETISDENQAADSVINQLLIQQMNALSALTGRYSGLFMVFAPGNTAARLIQSYNKNELALPDAFITYSPFWPEQDRNKRLATALATVRSPVLDISTSWDNRWSASTAPKRKIAAARQFKLHYRQVVLTGQKLSPNHMKLLSRRIYGWLHHMGW